MGQKGKGNIQNIEDIRKRTVPDRNFAAGNMEEDVKRRAGADMVILIQNWKAAALQNIPVLFKPDSGGKLYCSDGHAVLSD